MNTLLLWPEYVLYIGDSFDPDIHRHHAVQCCIALEGQLKIRGSREEPWRSCMSVVIGAGIEHGITNPEGPVALLYLEKTSRDYRSILDYHCVRPGCEVRSAPLLSDKPVPAALQQALRSCASTAPDDATANNVIQSCLSFFQGAVSQRQPLDPRLTKVLAFMHQHPEQTFEAATLASIACLSESRLQHLFKDSIGIPIRRYALWCRLRHVVEMALGGSTLMNAAHDAGFADSAHFSRTFKAMFGIAPSLLFSGSSAVNALFCEHDSP